MAGGVKRKDGGGKEVGGGVKTRDGGGTEVSGGVKRRNGGGKEVSWTICSADNGETREEEIKQKEEETD